VPATLTVILQTCNFCETSLKTIYF